MTTLTKEVCKPSHRRESPTRRRPLEELLRARPGVVTSTAVPDSSRRSMLDRTEVRGRTTSSFAANRGRVPGRQRLRRDDRDSRASRYEVRPAKLPAGTYTNITGNTALALGSRRGQRQLSPGCRSSSVRTRSRRRATSSTSCRSHKNFGVRTFQAEDEIAAIGMPRWAPSFAGHDRDHHHERPRSGAQGRDLSVSRSWLELPLLIVVDIQRGGPSTGLPTKTEAADLLMAVHGRHGEAPHAVVAASTPADCFDTAIEAVRIARRSTARRSSCSPTDTSPTAPSRGSLPTLDELPRSVGASSRARPNGVDAEGQRGVLALRARRTTRWLARSWAIPGTPGLMHRSRRAGEGRRHRQHQLRPENHEKMVRLRDAKRHPQDRRERSRRLEVQRRRRRRHPRSWAGARPGRAITSAVGRIRTRRRGEKVAHVHLTHLHPFAPKDLGEILAGYSKRMIVPEMNLGAAHQPVAGRPILVDAQGDLTKVSGSAVQVTRDRPGDRREARRTRRRREDRRRAHGRCVMNTVTGRCHHQEADWSSDQEVRWCPGCGDYAILARRCKRLMPELGIAARKHRFYFRHRLLQPVPVLHEHLRDALDPWPLRRRSPPGSPWPGPTSTCGSIGGDGDMLSIGGNHLIHALRRNVNLNDPVVQQPDLRAHQGPVLAHERGRQGHQVDPDGFARSSPFNPISLARSGPRRPSWPAPTTSIAST